MIYEVYTELDCVYKSFGKTTYPRNRVIEEILLFQARYLWKILVITISMQHTIDLYIVSNTLYYKPHEEVSAYRALKLLSTVWNAVSSDLQSSYGARL